MTGGHSSSPVDAWVQTVVTVSAEDGLHARPAIRLSQLARTFSSAVRIGIEGQDRWVDVKSVARLIGLRIESGKNVVLRAAGDDAEAALVALRELIQRDFGQNGGHG